jgi:hypothetical protein
MLGRAVEDMRQGIREQFESEWARVEVGAAKPIPHGLAEVPHSADALFSLTADGQKPITAPSGVTLSRDETNVTLTNGYSAGGWFKVRAN